MAPANAPMWICLHRGAAAPCKILPPKQIPRRRSLKLRSLYGRCALIRPFSAHGRPGSRLGLSRHTTTCHVRELKLSPQTICMAGRESRPIEHLGLFSARPSLAITSDGARTRRPWQVDCQPPHGVGIRGHRKWHCIPVKVRKLFNMR